MTLRAAFALFCPLSRARADFNRSLAGDNWYSGTLVLTSGADAHVTPAHWPRTERRVDHPMRFTALFALPVNVRLTV